MLTVIMSNMLLYQIKTKQIQKHGIPLVSVLR